MKLELTQNEELDDLGGGYQIIQNREYFLFGIDSVLLADFAASFIKPKDKVGDIGTGSGVIPILIAKRKNIKELTAFEIQESLVELADRNFRLNHLEENLKAVHQDVRDLNNIKPNSYDVLVSNPPYFENVKTNNPKREILSPNKNKRIARSEETLTLDELFKFSKKALKQRGKLILVYKPDRLSDLIIKAHDNLFEPKIIRFVYPRKGKNANLCLIQFTKQGKIGLKVQEPLVIYEGDRYTEEILKIYMMD